MTAQTGKVRTIPEGYHTVTPWIIVDGAGQLLDFLKNAFGAQELARMENPDGRIGHAETRIGDSVVMLFDNAEDWQPTPAFMRLYVEDADAVHAQALKAGAVSVTPVTLLAFGDKVGRVRDPFGNIWWIQQRVEALSFEEMEKRSQQPQYADAMRQVEESLHREMSSRRQAKS